MSSKVDGASERSNGGSELAPRRHVDWGPAKGAGHGGPAMGPDRHPITIGTRAPRVYGPFAEQLAAGLAEDRPDLAGYPEAVAGWATAEAVAALLRRHLADVGPVDPDTRQTRDRLLQEVSRAEGSAARHRALLGLDPRSEASLARDRAEAATLAVDLGALAERGRRALANRALAIAGAANHEQLTAGTRPELADGAPDLAGIALENARAEQAARAAEWANRR